MQYIVNADDFGRTEDVNQAIVYGFDHGYLSRTTIMVNMPFFEEAVELSKKHGFFDKVGLHINLTSGRPLTDKIKTIKSIVDSRGYFNEGFFKNKRMQFLLTPKERAAIIEEVDAQIEKYLNSGFTLLHADSHGHVHALVSLRKMICKVLKRYRFKSIRISLNLHRCSYWKKLYKNFANHSFEKFSGDKNRSLYLGSLKNVFRNESKLDGIHGKCEIMLHPNYYKGNIYIGESLQYTDLDRIRMK